MEKLLEDTGKKYYAFDETTGILFIRGGAMRVLPWSCGCTLEIKTNGQWVKTHSDFPVASAILPGGDPEHPVSLFRAAIPENILQMSRQFCTEQLAIIQVCHSSDRATEMLSESPTLLWYLAPHLVSQEEFGMRSIHASLGLKRNILVEEICRRKDSWVVRFIQNLPPPADISFARELLQTLMATPYALETIRHNPKPQWHFLQIAAKRAFVFRSPVGRSLFIKGQGMDIDTLRRVVLDCEQLLEDTAALGEELDIKDCESIVNSCKTMGQLNALHKKWSLRLRDDVLKIVKKEGNYLPPPPMPGNEVIEPITTLYDLHMEGRAMHHCVGAYKERIRAGKSYIYKVLHPKRATLEVRLSERHEWKIEQLKGPCNSDPGQESLAIVQNWLRNTISLIHYVRGV